MNLKEHQPPLDIDAQIENLKNLGLTIPDEDSAKEFLSDVSYFRFIKAYSLGMKPKNGKYIEGTSFDTLKELYLFNSNFRQLLFPLIERVEIDICDAGSRITSVQNTEFSDILTPRISGT